MFIIIIIVVVSKSLMQPKEVIQTFAISPYAGIPSEVEYDPDPNCPNLQDEIYAQEVKMNFLQAKLNAQRAKLAAKAAAQPAPQPISQERYTLGASRPEGSGVLAVPFSQGS
jgi:hypothetical protein